MAYQAGICPYCGSRELSLTADEGEFTPTAAAKRIVCCRCGREHQIQYRPIGMRVFDEADERVAAREVALAEPETPSQPVTGPSTCPMRQIVSTLPGALPRRIHWLIVLHVAVAVFFLYVADGLNAPEYLGIFWLALLHVQLGLVGVWIGVGGSLAIARGIIVIVVGTVATLLLAYADVRDLDEILPWFLPVVFVAAGLFALVGQLGYRFRIDSDRGRLTCAKNTQFSILHLLVLMTVIGVLIFLATIAHWNDRIASLSFAGLVSLGILIVCWAVLGDGQVAFRYGLSLAAVLGLGQLLLVGLDEWRAEAIVIVCVAACFVFAVLVATFSVLRTAGFRFGREGAIDDRTKQTR